MEGRMPFCTKCGTKSDEEARFCISCGSVLYTIAEGRVEAKVKIDASRRRLCPFCRQSVDPKASRCPHCSAEIGLLENCISCPSCRELVVPAKATATDEKGLATDLAKLALGGHYFLS